MTRSQVKAVVLGIIAAPIQVGAAILLDHDEFPKPSIERTIRITARTADFMTITKETIAEVVAGVALGPFIDDEKLGRDRERKRVGSQEGGRCEEPKANI